jgi:hypothetical protein
MIRYQIDDLDVIVRATRKGQKGVSITRLDGSIIDITPERAKEYVPEPKAETGLRSVKFEDALPGSKGKKRTPTQEELDLLKRLTEKSGGS